MAGMVMNNKINIDELYDRICRVAPDFCVCDEPSKVEDGSDLMCVDPAYLPPEDPNDLICSSDLSPTVFALWNSLHTISMRDLVTKKMVRE